LGTVDEEVSELFVSNEYRYGNIQMYCGNNKRSVGE